MIRRLPLALAATMALAAAAHAAEPIRELPIPTIERLGQAMARQDAAAWVATDALRPRVPDLQAARLKGWIVVDTPTGQRVRFLRDVGQGLEAGWDVDVTPDLKTTVAEPADRTLTPEEKSHFAAWNTAAESLRGQPICRPRYNHIVLPDPEGDGWLVWLMAPMTELGTIPIGGHYRVSVSADGKTVKRRDALSASCMVIPKPDEKVGKPVAAFVTHVVSPTPVETHVFLQMQSRQALIVGAGGRMWSVLDGRVRDEGPIGGPAPPK